MISASPLRGQLNGLLRTSRLLSHRTTASRILSSRTQQQFRLLHKVPTIGRHNDTIIENGIDGLFSPQQVEMSWSQYQKLMVDRLNHILAGDPREFWEIKSILLDTARNPSTAHTFNYASMAHNNHFFFRGLAPNPVDIPSNLKADLTRCFSSIDNLRKTFLANAAAMFGPGFVWLVQDRTTDLNDARNFKILTTYLAGTPYPGAHYRQQNRDLNTSNLLSEKDYMRQNHVQNRPGFSGMGNQKSMSLIDGGGDIDRQRFGGADIVPILCVNTWEHCYLMDWGLGGKMQYLESWWDHIDWEVVDSNCINTTQGGRR